MTAPACRELVLLMPNYAPAIGGGAVYARLLAEGLADRGHVGQVTVLTEAHPGCPRVEDTCGGRVRVQRLYPYRSARAERHPARHLLYGIEQARFSGLLARRWTPGSVLLVHGSFHLHPNSLRWIVPLLKRQRPPRPALVADIRDPRLPPRRMRELHPYDAVIACGEAVRAHLAQDPALAPKLHTIPVPLAETAPPGPESAEVAARHGLVPGRYLLWTNGILRRKGIDTALAAMQRLRARRPELTLAAAGRRRDRDARHDAAIRDRLLTDLGPVDHGDIPALAAQAALVLNISEIEGMPRGALEALAAGARVLLPPGVPEFAAACPEHIADPRDPDRLARQIETALAAPPGPPPYPLSRHTPAAVLPRYAGVFESVTKYAAS